MTTTYVKTLITDEATDADSPVTETVVQDIAQSVNYLIDFCLNGSANTSGLAAVAGAYYIFCDHGTQTELSDTYTKHHEIQIWRPGTYRVYFEGKGAGSLAFYRIYKNGVAVGTARQPAGTDYIAYTEDFTGLVKGDLIQLYTHGNGADSAVSRRFAVGVTVATADGLSHTFEASDAMMPA